MSFRTELNKHLTALPVAEVKKLVSKYNKELDIKPISKLKKAEIIEKIKSKKPMDKQLLTKLTNEARATVEGRKAQKASEKEDAKKKKEEPKKKVIKVKKSKNQPPKAKPDFLDLDKDGDKKEPMKKAAKEAKKKGNDESATTKTTSMIIENWGKAVNNIELEQTEKKLTDTIRTQLQKKASKIFGKPSLNIDGLFSANPKLANDLFAKYPPQKVLDGYKKYVEYLDDEGDQEIRQDKVTDYFEAKDGRLQPTFKTKALNQASIAKLEKANEFKLSKAKKVEPKTETKTSRPKGDLLKKLVFLARDHKKNGIGAEGVRAYKKLVDEFLKTNPPKKEEALAKTLYNFIINNVLRGKKKTVPNLNRLLKELDFKEIGGSNEPKNKMPSGVHIHLDGKTMKYNSVKEGQAAFDKIRSNRSKKPYKKMTLMDGDKVLDYSA